MGRFGIGRLVVLANFLGEVLFFCFCQYTGRSMSSIMRIITSGVLKGNGSRSIEKDELRVVGNWKDRRK